jgi:hypothetical protein
MRNISWRFFSASGLFDKATLFFILFSVALCCIVAISAWRGLLVGVFFSFLHQVSWLCAGVLALRQAWISRSASSRAGLTGRILVATICFCLSVSFLIFNLYLFVFFISIKTKLDFSGLKSWTILEMRTDPSERFIDKTNYPVFFKDVGFQNPNYIKVVYSEKQCLGLVRFIWGSGVVGQWGISIKSVSTNGHFTQEVDFDK